ncbi:GyrI-like domain-containing protein [Pseudomonas purpurea]|uniref:GyrI-like domain-containing protein n=1 Tax=Pseudomonas purpurea TaxID=3136737 RepID=UPI0032657155
MEVKQLDIAPFSVSGLQVRTFNRDEQQPETAKIGPMWGRFFADQAFSKIPNAVAESLVYGVYSNYESDANGAFDVTAGRVVTAPAKDFATVDIQGGRYLVFEASGPMPESVIATWGQVWQYFEEHTEIKRAFVSDFEAYNGPDSVSVYIGIR